MARIVWRATHPLVFAVLRRTTEMSIQWGWTSGCVANVQPGNHRTPASALYLFQARHGLGVFRRECRKRNVKGLEGILSGRSHPDLMQCLLDLGLHHLRNFVEHIGRLVHPTALMNCLGKDLAQRLQKPRAPSPTASFGAWPSPCSLMRTSNSDQLCSDSRYPSSMATNSFRC